MKNKSSLSVLVLAFVLFLGICNGMEKSDQQNQQQQNQGENEQIRLFSFLILNKSYDEATDDITVDGEYYKKMDKDGELIGKSYTVVPDGISQINYNITECYNDSDNQVLYQLKYWEKYFVYDWESSNDYIKHDYVTVTDEKEKQQLKGKQLSKINGGGHVSGEIEYDGNIELLRKNIYGDGGSIQEKIAEKIKWIHTNMYKKKQEREDSYRSDDGQGQSYASHLHNIGKTIKKLQKKLQKLDQKILGEKFINHLDEDENPDTDIKVAAQYDMFLKDEIKYKGEEEDDERRRKI